MKKLPIYITIYISTLTLPTFASLRLAFATDASGSPTMEIVKW